MTVLGVDIGTTGVKAVAYAEDGRPLTSAHRGYALLSERPNYLELDPEAVSGAVLEVIGKAAQEAGKDSIRAIAGAALGEAVVPLDRKGRFLANTIIALDSRAQVQMARLVECIPPEEYFSLTGQLPHPIVSAGKIMWWKDERPEVFREADRFLCWNEVLAHLLGVEPTISPSLAARTGMYDLRARDWSDRVLEAAGIDRKTLPPIVASGEAVGRVSPDMVSRLGLAKDCVLVSGGWDQACVALGSGAIEPGEVVNSMGSTDSLNATFDHVQTPPEMMAHGLTCSPHAVEGLFLSVGFSLTGGNLLSWCRDTLGPADCAKDSAADYFSSLAALAESSRRPVWVLPHFVGSGTPAMDPNSLGAVLGLSLSTTPADVACGMLEGLALEMRQNLDNLRASGIPVKQLLAGSGGARTSGVVQLRADALGMPITVLENEETGCMACAMLALSALEGQPGLEEIVGAWVTHGRSYAPRPEMQAYFTQRLALHRELYPALRELQHRLHDFPERPGPAD